MWSVLAVVVAVPWLANAQQLEEIWKQFKADYGKEYDSNGDEEERRYTIFKSNLDKITAHDSKQSSFWFGVNQFADLTADEFAGLYTGGYRVEAHQNETVQKVPFLELSGDPLPEAVDWVEKGAVTPVKDQAQCGSCWAFSTTGAIEGAYFVASGKLLSLSEEDLVQCDHDGDQGCNGGLMDHAFGWVKKNGICSEDDYPYSSGVGVTGKCRAPACQPVVTVHGHVDVPRQDEEALKAAVATQPVSIAIEADKTVFQLYKGGVMDSASCGKSLDHGVLLVGYGSEDGKDYWKVKNSWGASWGEQGYIRLGRGENICGVAMQPSYPTGAEAVTPGPSPPPSPPPSPSSHYEDPAGGGCLPDEKALQVQGVSGAFCSPQCSFLFHRCPAAPASVTAHPQCALQDATGQKYCVLMCDGQREDDDQCGQNASCKEVQTGTSICTYDDASGSVEESVQSHFLGSSLEKQEELVV